MGSKLQILCCIMNAWNGVNSLMGCKAEGHGACPRKQWHYVKWRWCVCRRKLLTFLVHDCSFGLLNLDLVLRGFLTPQFPVYVTLVSVQAFFGWHLVSNFKAQGDLPKQTLPSLQCKHSFLPTQLSSSKN
jgi:hypothetical protein